MRAARDAGQHALTKHHSPCKCERGRWLTSSRQCSTGSTRQIRQKAEHHAELRRGGLPPCPRDRGDRLDPQQALFKPAAWQSRWRSRTVQAQTMTVGGTPASRPAAPVQEPRRRSDSPALRRTACTMLVSDAATLILSDRRTRNSHQMLLRAAAAAGAPAGPTWVLTWAISRRISDGAGWRPSWWRRVGRTGAGFIRS